MGKFFTSLCVLIIAALYSFCGFAQSSCFNSIRSNNTIDAIWPMDGNTNDVSGGGHNSTGGTGPSSYSNTDTISGQAAYFNGTGGIQYSDGTFMNSSITNISFGVWIKPTSVTPANHQIIFEEGGSSGLAIYLSTTGEIVFVVADGSQANSDDLRFSFPTDGQYHHVAFNYNGRLEIFLDGRIQKILNSGFGSIASHSDAGGLGATFGSTSAAKVRFASATFTSFTGFIDEAFYTRNLVNNGNLLQYGRCFGKNIFTSLGCASDAFMVQDASSRWISINLVTGRTAPTSGTVDDNYAPSGTSMNAIGYNPIDGTIYGVDVSSGFILQTQVTTNLTGYDYFTYRIGYISTLAGKNIVVGDVYNGKLYLHEGTNGGSNTHWIVDVNPSSPTYLLILSTVTENASLGIYDWAVNPLDGYLYTVTYNTGSLFKIDTATGVTTNLGSVGLGTNKTFGACYFDNHGFFYIYNNENGGIYRIDVDGASKSGVFFAQTRSGLNFNDGARCANAPLPIDFGDAPDTSSATVGVGTASGQYETRLSNSGPRHLVNSFVPLRIGSTVTIEDDGQPTANATGDIDDGIASFPMINGGSEHHLDAYGVNISVTNLSTQAATLYGWIDWDNNGIFQPEERRSVVVSASTNNGTVMINWTNITLGGAIGSTGVFARFRLSTDTSAAQPTGSAMDGEVEDYFIPFNIPLPVTLVNFEVYKHDNTKALLKWETASENQNTGFQIEHSNDGIYWNYLDFVNSKAPNGFSSSKLYYDYIDQIPDRGINYYRLKQIDIDNKFSYSPIRMLKFDKYGYPIIISPNPAGEKVMITNLSSSVNKVTITDVTGRVVYTDNVGLGNDYIDLNNFATGIYILSVMNEYGVITNFKLVKK